MSTTTPTTPSTPPPRKDNGQYVIAPDKIPTEVIEWVKSRTGGEKPPIFPAKEHGSYKGHVMMNGDNWLVQAVGKEGKTIVVHRKTDLDFVTQRLQFLDEKKRMNGADVQIHYGNGQAKVYQWDRDKDYPDKAAPEAGKALDAGSKKVLTADQFVEAANTYANNEIKNATSRKAFLNHVALIEHKLKHPEKAATQEKPPEAAPEVKKAAASKAKEEHSQER